MYLKTETESVDWARTSKEISILDKLKLKRVENREDFISVDEEADAVEEPNTAPKYMKRLLFCKQSRFGETDR